MPLILIEAGEPHETPQGPGRASPPEDPDLGVRCRQSARGAPGDPLRVRPCLPTIDLACHPSRRRYLTLPWLGIKIRNMRGPNIATDRSSLVDCQVSNANPLDNGAASEAVCR